MTLLQLMHQDAPRVVLLRTDDTEMIEAELEAVGVRFARWELAPPGESDVLTAYRRQIDELREQGEYQLVDVAAIAPDPADPDWPAKAKAARAKFLDEHTHGEDEVRFFTSGRGCFYLHIGDQVLAVVCTAGDLLSVPAGTRHWFDMGARPVFTAIRFFQRDDGWVGDFTSSGISREFPPLEELIA